jgi:hypothetical protein
VDAFAFTKGGFVVGTVGMEEKLGRFAQSFRALPAAKADDVPGLTDPVSVRQFRDNGRLYFYYVNRMSCPVELQLELAGAPAKIVNLRTGQAHECAGGKATFSVEPYAFESFMSEAADLKVSGGRVAVPAEVIEGLKTRLRELEGKASAIKPEAAAQTDSKAYFAQAHRLLDAGMYGQLHFLLEDSRAATLDIAAH